MALQPSEGAVQRHGLKDDVHFRRRGPRGGVERGFRRPEYIGRGGQTAVVAVADNALRLAGLRERGASSGFARAGRRQLRHCRAYADLDLSIDALMLGGRTRLGVRGRRDARAVGETAEDVEPDIGTDDPARSLAPERRAVELPAGLHTD